MPIDFTEVRKIDEFLRARRKPGLLLTRPYPATRAPDIRSRLGGLPNLPADVAWPRGRSYARDVPMHFLAQIDCSELPAIDPRMPEQGLLFFFAVNDEEQIWNTEEPGERIRVLYAPDGSRLPPPRPAPADLPPIQDLEASDTPHRPDWLLPGERGPVLHQAWPVVASRFDTWPDWGTYEDRPVTDYRLYQRRVGMLRAGAVVAATGLPTRSEYFPAWDTGFGQPFVLPGHGDSDRQDFPQLGIMIDRIARMVARHLLQPALDPSSGVLARAGQWVETARQIGPAGIPDDRTREAFRGWLSQLADPSAPSDLGFYLPSLITKGLNAAIACAGGTDGIAGSIPPYFYNVLETGHLPFEQTKPAHYVDCRDWTIEANVHQMLGHAPMLQSDSPDPESGPLCLLRLATDPGIELSFGDMGYATIWIDPADLQQRRFDRCSGVVESH